MSDTQSTKFKYMDIVKWTSEQIDVGIFEANSRFLSEAELCRKFNCSRQTVRKALDILEQEGRILRVQGSGTFIAAGTNVPDLNHRDPETKSMTIGLMSTFMDNYIFPSILRGIESVVSDLGYALQLASTDNSVEGEARALRLLMSRPLDGLIVEPTRSALPCANLDLYYVAERKGIPMVFIDSFYPELSFPHVALDDVKAGYLATHHLIDMGHRDIATVFPHSNRQGHLRYLGYVKALSERGIPIKEQHISWYSRANMTQIAQGGHFLEILADCSALLAYNDWVAVTIIGYLKEHGIAVPDDLSVVGIDNSEVARVRGLTSVAHPASDLGKTAARLLLSMINGEKVESYLFPPRLETRGTVKKLGI